MPKKPTDQPPLPAGYGVRRAPEEPKAEPERKPDEPPLPAGYEPEENDSPSS